MCGKITERGGCGNAEIERGKETMVGLLLDTATYENIFLKSK